MFHLVAYGPLSLRADPPGPPEEDGHPDRAAAGGQDLAGQGPDEGVQEAAVPELRQYRGCQDHTGPDLVRDIGHARARRDPQDEGLERVHQGFI